MNKKLLNYIKCSACSFNEIGLESLECSNCKNKLPNIDGVLRFVDGGYHSSFGYQWNKFSKVQLDSFNGSDESEARLLQQSGLSPEDFIGKTILEIGAGNGRFTEILIKYGANVIAVDYSTAIDANSKNNNQSNNVLFVQADLFNLPVVTDAFDVVLCYGVIQHTGNNKKALDVLAKYPKPGGLLLVDIYSSGIRHFNPWVYLIRPFFSLIKTSDEKRMRIVEKFVDAVFPMQLSILRRLYNKSGILKMARYIINRSPNSVYGINLFLDGKISLDIAKQWCVLDTYDGWAPKHDHPVSQKSWKNLIDGIMAANRYHLVKLGVSGQGHTATLRKVMDV